MRKSVLLIACVAVAVLLLLPAAASATTTADQITQLQKAVAALKTLTAQQGQQIQALQTQVAAKHTILSASGAPYGKLGAVGDLYLNTASYQLYGPKTCLGWGAPVSLKGPEGDAGAPGPQGAKGEVGPIGPAGPQGEVGPVGKDGAVGPQGEKGDVGPAGLQGDRGDIGPMGPAGEKGGVGPIGPIGTPGEQGEQGLAGPQGPAGDVSSDPVYAKWVALSPFLRVEPGSVAGLDGPNVVLSGANLFTETSTGGYALLGLPYGYELPAPDSVSLTLYVEGDHGTQHWRAWVKWTAAESDHRQAFRIYRRDSATGAGDAWHLLGEVASTATSYFDDSPVAGHTYEYAVRSIDAYGGESSAVSGGPIHVPVVDHLVLSPAPPGPLAVGVQTPIEVRVVDSDGRLTPFSGYVDIDSPEAAINSERIGLDTWRILVDGGVGSFQFTRYDLFNYWVSFTLDCGLCDPVTVDYQMG